tara:strand:- start:414 stop:1202 length:789 start_codon:yes stop_codon:yes gene_type:complete
MFSGVLKKMVSEYGNEIIYYLNFENEFMVMNQFLNKKIKLIFNGYECLNCKSDEIIFRQGYCKKCFYDLPITGDWIMKPELSKAHLNIEDRDLEYEKKVQIQPHIVYLAFSSHLKVGVTRKSQLTTRWVDQGAHQAISLAEAPNRFLAGICEVELKSYYSDKTNWRKMLENNFKTIDLKKEKDMAVKKIPGKIYSRLVPVTDDPLTINFPVLKIPEKVKSLNIVKEKNFEGILKGIKGQYLIFKDNSVFNIRGNEGLKITIK